MSKGFLNSKVAQAIGGLVAKNEKHGIPEMSIGEARGETVKCIQISQNKDTKRFSVYAKLGTTYVIDPVLIPKFDESGKEIDDKSLARKTKDAMKEYILSGEEDKTIIKIQKVLGERNKKIGEARGKEEVLDDEAVELDDDIVVE